MTQKPELAKDSQVEENASLFRFSGPDDPDMPLNWPLNKKIVTTAMYGFTTMGATLATAMHVYPCLHISPTSKALQKEFGKSGTVVTLTVSLMMVGFAVGPMVWAPLSELFGRKYTVAIPYFISGLFALGCATASNFETLIIMRFFMGLFGSAPVTNSGGVIGDIWTPQQRGIALVFYSFCTASGPVLGPVVGAALHDKWRWTEYLCCMWMLVMSMFVMLLLDETYAPAILTSKARRLRFETKNWALHAQHEEWPVNLHGIAVKYLIRPFQLLGNLTCFLMAFYGSFVFELSYLCLAAIPVSFGDHRGWPRVSAELPFLALMLGIVIGGLANILNSRGYVKRMKANNGKPVPEARLVTTLPGSVLLCAGIFLFGWTAASPVHWIVPCLALVLLGFGFLVIFQGCVNYLMDTFPKYAASAISITTFMRSIFAAASALFGNPMLEAMGVSWGISIFGFISAVMIPVPFLFYFYGARIRQRSMSSGLFESQY
ncbi:MFS general substrate transporter [Trichoderma sp. SZMC 28015]